jgi:hypothetical protein
MTLSEFKQELDKAPGGRDVIALAAAAYASNLGDDLVISLTTVRMVDLIKQRNRVLKSVPK